MVDKVVGGLEGNIWEDEKEYKKETITKVCGNRVYDDNHLKANKQHFRGSSYNFL